MTRPAPRNTHAPLSSLRTPRRAWLLTWPAIASLLVGSFLFTPASARTPCLPYEIATAILKKKHNERRISYGVSGGGWLAEVWANTETGTWTYLRRNGKGLTCIMDGGEGFAMPQTVDQKGGAL